MVTFLNAFLLSVIITVLIISTSQKILKGILTQSFLYYILTLSINIKCIKKLFLMMKIQVFSKHAHDAWNLLHFIHMCFFGP